MKEDWIEQLRRRAADYEETPPSGVWEGIRDRVSATTRRKRRRFVWWTIPAAAACLLLVFTLRHSVPSVPPSHLGVSDEKVLAGGEAADSHSAPSHSLPSTNQTVEPLTFIPLVNTQHVSHTALAKPDIEERVAVVPDTMENQPVYVADVNHEDLSATAGELPQAQQEERQPARQPDALVAYLPDNGSALPDITPKVSSRLGFSVHATRGLGGSGTSASGQLAPGHSGMAAPPPSSDYPEPDYWQHEEIEEPSSFGIAVSWQFAKRWRAELGLDYTTLYEYYSSDWPRGNSKEMGKYMNFVSVPVRAHYLLWDRKLLQAYVSAGITAEQCVRNYRNIFRTYENGHVGFRREHGVSRPFQFSANMGLGVQFNFNRYFGLYVQSEFGYYVPNGSSDRNYYTEHRKVVKSEVGFRVNLNRMYKNQKQL